MFGRILYERQTPVMNPDKAREYFSAHYEGTLEPGLRQALEARLRTDSVLQADYAAFAETMEELRSLAYEEIEIPIFLSDRIATRLEEEQARKRMNAPVWGTWLRGFAFSGLAALAIFGAVRSLHSGGPTSNMELGPSSAPSEQMIFTGNGPDVTLTYRPSTEHTLIVSSGITGHEMERFTVDSSSPAHPFENALAGTALFEIQVQGAPDVTMLAIPGSGTTPAATGSGTIKEFAVAVAGHFHTPVLLHAADLGKHVVWKLDGRNAVQSAISSLASDHYVVEQREAGILNISDH